MCVWEGGGGYCHFYQVSRISPYGHSGVLGSGHSHRSRPTVRAQGVCVHVWRHIIEEGLYGSAGGLERLAPVLQRMTLEVSALRAPCTPPSPRPEPLALRSYDASVLARPCLSTCRPLRRARLHGRSLSGRWGSCPRCLLSPRWPRPASPGALCTPRGGPPLVGVRSTRRLGAGVFRPDSPLPIGVR